MRLYPIIAIVGAPRSGTSFTARILRDKFGYIMASEYANNDDYKCEDDFIVGLNRKLSFGVMSADNYQKEFANYITKMSAHRKWGFKDPRMILGLPWLQKHLNDDLIIIRTYRTKELVIKSMVKNLRWDAEFASFAIDQQDKLLDGYLQKFISIKYSEKHTPENELSDALNEQIFLPRKKEFIGICIDDVKQKTAIGAY